MNRLVGELEVLANVVPLHLVMGNHDYVDPTTPFFKFASMIPNVRFYPKPLPVVIGGMKILMLPHTRSWRADWKGLKWKHHNFILMHQPVNGAVGSSGHIIEGVPKSVFKNKRLRRNSFVIAGDIHVPQRVGNILYCGAPYPICFGDNYEPRILFYDGRHLKSIKRTTLKKAVLNLQDGSHSKLMDELTEGDMVRVILHLPRSEYGSWEEHKKSLTKEANERGLVLCGIELKPLEANPAKPTEVFVGKVEAVKPADLLARYCKAHEVEPELVQAARRFL